MTHDPTITDDYRALCAEEHQRDPQWGSSSKKWARFLMGLFDGHSRLSILDYGCGKGALASELRRRGMRRITAYDPARPGIERKPEGWFDCVICTDVLEHVEADYIDAVLKELHDYLKPDGFGFFAICVQPAQKHLPDGRNAHITVCSKEWWREQLHPYFEFEELAIRPKKTDREMVMRAWRKE